MPSVPRKEDAASLCQNLFNCPAQSVTRFPTGLCHYVYDVALADGRKIVARIAAAENRRSIEGGIFWSNLLRPLGVPLPDLFFADAHAEPFGYMILDRLPGVDVGHLYITLSPDEKRSLAVRLASIQAIVASLPRGGGYGYVFHRDGPFQHNTWRSVLEAGFARACEWIKAVPGIEPREFAAVQAGLDRHDGYLLSVAPTPFLDDITTKNVIIQAGRLSGIVDVDELCFGDPLFAVALTRMSLLARGYETDYIDYWTQAISLSDADRGILDFYTALHGASFVGELGQAFNRDAKSAVYPAEPKRLLNIIGELVGRV